MGCGPSTDLASLEAAANAADYDDDYDSDDEDRCDYANARNATVDEGEEIQDDDPNLTFSTLKTKTTPPWAGSIQAPDPEPENNPAPPEQKLELEWVYGFRNDDSFDNIAITDSGDVVYPSAAVVVKYTKASHSQSFNQTHTDDVLCLAQCKNNKNLVASGQNSTLTIVNGTRRSADPLATVWDTATGDIKTFASSNKKATRCVGLDHDGKYLACVGYDQACTINIWDIESQALLATDSADHLPHKIFGLVWGGSDQFVTFGVAHLKTWTFSEGELKPSTVSTDTSFYSADNFNGGYAVGTKKGEVWFVNGKEETRARLTDHSKSVFAIKAYEGGLVTGGKDKKINVYDNELKLLHTFETSSYPRSIALSGNRLVAGLREGLMIEIADFTVAGSAQTEIVNSHWDGELWALDVDPNDPSKFVTAGEDNTVFIWDKNEHKHIKRTVFSDEKRMRRKRERASTTSSHGPNHCARGISISGDSKQIAIGSNDGKIHSFDYSNLTKTGTADLNKHSRVKVIKGKDNWIQTIQYSPDGQLLAVGTHGMVIVIVDPADFSVKEVLNKGHNSAITSIDWSKDGLHLQSNDMAYELLFHDIDTKDLTQSAFNPHSAQLKDVEWNSQTCKMGWGVRGIWETGMDGSDINNCDRSPNGELIASADDWGRVNLYNYPVGEENEKSSFLGHSSHVVDAKFTKDSQHVISVGGNDKTILQWKIV